MPKEEKDLDYSRASKETCREVREIVAAKTALFNRNDFAKIVQFFDAAERKLPSEAAYEAEAERRGKPETS